MAPKIYNKLPKLILDSNNINAFKKGIIDLLINKTYYSINEYLTDSNI